MIIAKISNFLNGRIFYCYVSLINSLYLPVPSALCILPLTETAVTNVTRSRGKNGDQLPVSKAMVQPREKFNYYPK